MNFSLARLLQTEAMAASAGGPDTSRGNTSFIFVFLQGGLSTIESASVARYLVVREKDVARLRRTVGASWRGVAGMTFRRSLGRTIASL